MLIRQFSTKFPIFCFDSDFAFENGVSCPIFDSIRCENIFERLPFEKKGRFYLVILSQDFCLRELCIRDEIQIHSKCLLCALNLGKTEGMGETLEFCYTSTGLGGQYGSVHFFQ